MNARPTRRHARVRSKRHLLGVHLTAAPAGGVTLPDDAPRLTLRDPESTRTAFVTASISALLHALAIAILGGLAWMAPDIAEVIPIRIIRELPGSNNSAPAPRKLIQRRPVPNLAPAQLQHTVEPTTIAAAQVSAESLRMAEVDPSIAPAQVKRRVIESARVTAVTVANASQTSAVDLSQIRAVTVQPTDLNAPVVDISGPRQVAQGTQVAIGAAQVVAVLAEVGETNHTSQASPGEYTDGPINEIIIDTGVSDAYKGGTGGTGTAEEVVRCTESAFVQRYYNVIKERTQRRWTIPTDTPPDTKVVLSFQLDASGTATQVAYLGGSADHTLGASAVAALRAASPFPPMNDNVRCLAGLSLKATFIAEVE